MPDASMLIPRSKIYYPVLHKAIAIAIRHRPLAATKIHPAPQLPAPSPQFPDPRSWFLLYFGQTMNQMIHIPRHPIEARRQIPARIHQIGMIELDQVFTKVIGRDGVEEVVHDFLVGFRQCGCVQRITSGCRHKCDVIFFKDGGCWGGVQRGAACLIHQPIAFKTPAVMKHPFMEGVLS